MTRPVLSALVCPYCGDEFQPRWPNQVFCCRKHRERMHHSRRSPVDRCEWKLAYPDEAAALVGLDGTRAESQQPERLDVYLCPAGPHWHVGHERMPGRSRGGAA